MSERDRFRELRRRLFIMIGKALKEDHCHKSYEGAIELTVEYPNYFEDTAAVDYTVWYHLKIHCYVLGPQRHYELIGGSFDEVLDKFEQTLNEWESEWESEGE